MEQNQTINNINILKQWVRGEVLTYLKKHNQNSLYQTLIFNHTDNINNEDIQTCKEIIQDTLNNNPVFHNYIKENLYTTIDTIINNIDTTTRDTDEIENLTIQNHINNIHKRDIQNEDDIIDLISRYNETIDTTKKHINHQTHGESYHSQLIKKIRPKDLQWPYDNESQNNKLYHLIIDELDKEIEYYFADHIVGFDEDKLSTKKQRCTDLLAYIELLAVEKDRTITLDKLKTTNHCNYQPILTLLQPKTSYYNTKNQLVFNETKDQNTQDEPEWDTLSLLSRRCYAVINDQYRDQYKRGKDIIKELWVYHIDLDHHS